VLEDAVPVQAALWDIYLIVQSIHDAILLGNTQLIVNIQILEKWHPIVIFLLNSRFKTCHKLFKALLYLNNLRFIKFLKL